jgi:NTE family protein
MSADSIDHRRLGGAPPHVQRDACAPVPGADPGASHRLALVLGSGGVRSVAALGIAERLAREGIRPDLIVGCSSGALFGALVAMQIPAAEALRRATALWSAELTEQRRWRAWLEVVAPRLARFDAGFALRDDRLIRQRIAQGFGERRIEDLPTALRIAATEAASGAATILARGSLAAALRASMAVPVVFPSVEFGGQRLVDGVVSDPLPVGAARDARAVIALGFEGAMPRRVDRLSRLVARTSTTLINNLMRARIDAARARGQRIVTLELGLERHVGLWQTEAMPYLFEAGKRAAEARLDDIVRLLDPSPWRGTGGPSQLAAA